MTEYALRLTNGTDTAPRVRMGDALGLFPGSDALAGRSGLRPGDGGEVTVVAGSMSVQVTPFVAWIDATGSSLQGGYPFVCDATKTLALADGDATLDRTDTIVAVVREDAYDGSGATEAALEVVTGTPGLGAPALPATCVPLRDVTVPAGLSAGTGGLQASHLGADRRTRTLALGGVLPVAGVDERDALTELYRGMSVYRADTNRLEVYNGTGWDTYAPVPTTSANLTPSAAGWGGTLQVREIAPGVVQAVGSDLDVDTSTAGNYVDTGMVIPAGLRPLSQVLVASAYYNSTNTYRYKFDTDGTVWFQNTGAEGVFESVNITWFTS